VCSNCRSAFPVEICECRGCLTYLCENCLHPHLQTAGPHVRKLVARQLCACSAPAELLCCCFKRLPPLCYPCLELHKVAWPDELHVLVPIVYRSRVSDSSFIQNLAKKQTKLESRKAEMRINLQRLEVCETEFVSKCAQILSHLESYRSSTLAALHQAKDSLTQMIATAIRETDFCLCEETYTPRDSLVAALLSDTGSLAKHLFTYHLHLDPEALSLALQLNFDLVTPQTAPLQVPWITNKSMRLFDSGTQTWGQLWTFSKVFADENSCILPLPDDSFMVSGSSSAPTQVIGLRFSDHTITPFASFHIGRVGHGMLCWKGLACAFGGYDLRACEQLDLSAPQAWTSLGDMHYCRRFFNPCAYGTSVYLCGGDGTNTVEVFDGVARRFTVLSLTLPYSSNTLATVWQGTLFVFQHGYVTRWVLGSASPEVTKKCLVDSR